jgi:hypothetical protein
VNDRPLKKLKADHVSRVAVKFNNSHLPDGCQDANRWHCTFVPTFIGYVASYHDPWNVADGDSIRAMQTIWNQVYNQPKITHQIETQQAVYCVVSQLRLQIDP